MSAAAPAIGAAPISEGARITALDLIRGVAVLGILLMNVVSFAFGDAPYYNLSAGGSDTWLDWAIGVFGEIFVDQKFMGMFSLLFGAGMFIFIDRAAERGARGALLSLWRNVLLFAVGLAHFQLWYGDVLMIYAAAAFILLALRKLPAPALMAVGVAIFLLSVGSDLYGQRLVNAGAPLGGVWSTTAAEHDTVVALAWSAYIVRGIGMVLLGAGLYRVGFMSGAKSANTYRMTALIGLSAGLSLATAGVLITWLGDYSRNVAIIGQVPNNFGAIPASLGYVALLILWNAGADNWLKRRLRAVGRMALTNYLTQSILGVLVLTVLLADFPLTRSAMLVFVLAVWALQLWWSQAWLNRFRFGPAEWAWRVATYRRGSRCCAGHSPVISAIGATLLPAPPTAAGRT